MAGEVAAAVSSPGSERRPLIGVLALQGGFEAHERMLRRVGADTRQVRVPADLEGLDGLVIPGGESTTMTRGIAREGLAGPLRSFASAGRPVLGSCAGLIMLDSEHLGLMDLTARRNAFGRQLHSFEAEVALRGLDGGPIRGIFIRAPWIDRHGPEVEILAELVGHPIAARQGRMLAVAFHAELGRDERLHRLFLGLVGDGAQARA
ncbi:MAG: pyridoxal 5'-phosphate synthase glutaminase subunit PdxT [Solirubrobacteraceae bacterium]